MATRKLAGPRVVIGADGIPQFIEPIDLDALKKVKPSDAKGVAQLHEYLRIYGLNDANNIRMKQMQYLQRFNITPDDPNFKAALARLVGESNSGRTVVAMARRASESAQTIEAIDGNMGKEVMYVNEDDPCDECLALNGITEPVTWFMANNAMPSDRCLGKDNCKCDFVPV